MWVLRVAGGAAVGWNRKWSSCCLRPLSLCVWASVCVRVCWVDFTLFSCQRVFAESKVCLRIAGSVKETHIAVIGNLISIIHLKVHSVRHTHTLWSVLYYMRRLNRQVNWAVVQTTANKKKGPPPSEWGTASWVSCCWETLPIQPVSVPSKSQASCKGVKETPEVTTQTLNFKSHSLTLLRKYLWIEGLVGVWRISAFQLFVLLCSHPRMYEQGNICPIWT